MTVLTEVMTIVAADLPAILLPLDLRPESWLADADRESAVLYGIDDSAVGVWLDVSRPRVDQVVMLADQVQEWAVEQLWTHARSATWPECPCHRDSHPLAGVVVDGSALWVCPRTRERVAEIGRLAAS